MARDGARQASAIPVRAQLARGLQLAESQNTGRCAKFMQQQAAVFTARKRLENFPAQLADLHQPRAKIFGQLLVDLAAQALREGGAFAGGGDGDLQVAAADHRAKKEIAIGNVVDAVAGMPRSQRPPDKRLRSLRAHRWRR
jgi:hypothetical protein